FDGHHHAGLQHGVAAARQARALVDLQPDAVTETVAEMVAVTGGGDDLPGGGVDLPAGAPRPDRGKTGFLSPEHQVINLPLARVWLPDHHGTGQVRAVPVHHAADVEGDQVARLDDPPRGDA